MFSQRLRGIRILLVQLIQDHVGIQDELIIGLPEVVVVRGGRIRRVAPVQEALVPALRVPGHIIT